MDNREENKKEFLKYADKQREGVKQYTNYWVAGAVIAAGILILIIFHNAQPKHLFPLSQY